MDRCESLGQGLRPLDELLVEPISQVLRPELAFNVLGRTRRCAVFEEAPDLVAVGGEDVGAIALNLLEFAEETFWNAEPLLDAPLALNLEVVLVADGPQHGPLQAHDLFASVGLASPSLQFQRTASRGSRQASCRQSRHREHTSCQRSCSRVRRQPAVFPTTS